MGLTWVDITTRTHLEHGRRISQRIDDSTEMDLARRPLSDGYRKSFEDRIDRSTPSAGNPRQQVGLIFFK